MTDEFLKLDDNDSMRHPQINIYASFYPKGFDLNYFTKPVVKLMSYTDIIYLTKTEYLKFRKFADEKFGVTK